LDIIFHFFDPLDTGFISREAFAAGCEALNKTLSWGQQIDQIDAIFSLMDMTGTKTISVNEFFEIFRIVERGKTHRWRNIFASSKSKKSPSGAADEDTLVLQGIIINIDSDREFISSRMPKLVLKKPQTERELVNLCEDEQSSEGFGML